MKKCNSTIPCVHFMAHRLACSFHDRDWSKRKTVFKACRYHTPAVDNRHGDLDSIDPGKNIRSTKTKYRTSDVDKEKFMRLAAAGYKTQEIADKMPMSYSYVFTYAKNNRIALNKLGRGKYERKRKTTASA